MNSKIDARLENFPKATNLVNFMKKLFERLYGKNEIEDLVDTLKYSLEKYSKDDSPEKTHERKEMEVEMEMLSNEIFVDVAEKTFGSGNENIPEGLLKLAAFFHKYEDNPLACELICCSGSIAIEEFIEKRGLKIRLQSLQQKKRFLNDVSCDFRGKFAIFEMCHYSFHTDTYDATTVKFALSRAKSFIGKLVDVKLTEEKKMELEKTDFSQ